MRYFTITFFRSMWDDSPAVIGLIPAKNKTRVKRVIKEAFPNAKRITVTELETPFE